MKSNNKLPFSNALIGVIVLIFAFTVHETSAQAQEKVSVKLMQYNLQDMFEVAHHTFQHPYYTGGKVRDNDDWPFTPAGDSRFAEKRETACSELEKKLDLDQTKDSGLKKYLIDYCRKGIWNDVRYNVKINNLASVINYGDPDLLTIEEIATEKALLDLRNKLPHLQSEGRLLITHSPDVRGINQALLYNPEKFSVVKDGVKEVFLPLYDEEMKRPLSSDLKSTLRDQDVRRGTPLRNFLIVKLAVRGTNPQLYLKVAVVHFPAPYHSIEMRRYVTSQLLNAVGKAKENETIILAGDFNTTREDDVEKIINEDLVKGIGDEEGESFFDVHRLFEPEGDEGQHLGYQEYRDSQNTSTNTNSWHHKNPFPFVKGTHFFGGAKTEDEQWSYLDHFYVSKSGRNQVGFFKVDFPKYVLTKGYNRLQPGTYITKPLRCNILDDHRKNGRRGGSRANRSERAPYDGYSDHLPISMYLTF